MSSGTIVLKEVLKKNMHKKLVIIAYSYISCAVLFNVYMEQCTSYPVAVHTIKFYSLRFDMRAIESEWLHVPSSVMFIVVVVFG